VRQSCLVIFVLLSLIYLVSFTVADEVQIPSWQVKHEQLQHLRDTIFNRLQEIHSDLIRLAKDKSPALLARLSLEPVEPRAIGYGLLPEIQENSPFGAVSPTRTVYSLKWLEGRFFEELENTQSLSDQLSQTSDLDSLVNRYEGSLKDLRHLENHLSYQEQWQKSVTEYPAFFQKKNDLIAQIREIEALQSHDGAEARRAELRDQLMEDVVSFKPAPGLALVVREGGERVLPVTVCTDIEDSVFLQVFEQGVDEAFNKSMAARAQRFSVELKWRFMAVEALYPEEAPGPGDRIDVKMHLSLFNDCRMILTTGGSSTYARTGDCIVLGTDPESRRTLAHEFGHLLGFSDAYVRGHDGDSSDEYGAILVEWTGLTNDLMGSSVSGKVSAVMIDTLLSAY